MDRDDTISVIRGMALSKAAARAGGEAVRTELLEGSDPECIRVRLSIGPRGVVLALCDPGLDQVLRDREVWRRVEATIRAAVDGL